VIKAASSDVRQAVAVVTWWSFSAQRALIRAGAS
jgi:hypothetical protein